MTRLTRNRIALACAAAALVGLVVLSVRAMVTDPTDGVLDPVPSPAASLPDGLTAHLVELDGRAYRCVIYYHGGVDCWEAHPAPTPQPARSS